MGMPPSSGDAPRSANERKPMPPWATKSPKALLGRLKLIALSALSSAAMREAVLGIVELVQHHHMAGAVEDDDGHRPPLAGFGGAAALAPDLMQDQSSRQ